MAPPTPPAVARSSIPAVYTMTEKQGRAMHDNDSPTDARDTNILVVHDEERQREILREVLAEEGHRVSAAASAEQALMLLSDRHIDIVISDIRMPVMICIDLLRKIIENNQVTQ